MSDIILINVTGRDRPGLTSSIISIMADYGLEILDIGQSVIYATLTWGMLVRFPAQASGNGDSVACSDEILKDLLFHFHKNDLQFSYQPVSGDGYEHWVSEQVRNRYILTLLSRNVSAEQVARVSGIIAAHGLNIDHISRLSGLRSLRNDKNDSHRTSCLEFSVWGTAPDQEGLRSDFLNLAADLGTDVAFLCKWQP